MCSSNLKPWQHLNFYLFSKTIDSRKCLMLLSLLLLNSLSLLFWLVPFRGKTWLKPHPDWYLLGVQLKFPDKHPRPFYMGVPSPGKDCCRLWLSKFQQLVWKSSSESDDTHTNCRNISHKQQQSFSGPQKPGHINQPQTLIHGTYSYKLLVYTDFNRIYLFFIHIPEVMVYFLYLSVFLNVFQWHFGQWPYK